MFVLPSTKNYNFSSTGQLANGLNKIESEKLGLFTANQNRMTIDPNGLVGIGTTTPLDKLHVNGNLRVNDNLILGGNLSVLGTAFTVNADTLVVSDPMIRLADNNPDNLMDFGLYGMYVDTGVTKFGGLIKDSTESKWHLFDNDTTEPGVTQHTINNSLLTIESDTGYVGIGITNPNYALDISATDAILVPKGTSGERPGSVTNGLFRYNTTLTQFEGYSNGSWAPIGGGAADLDGDTYIQAETSVGADNDELQFFTAGTERMHINSSGNIGINTNNPTNAMHFYDSVGLQDVFISFNDSILGATATDGFVIGKQGAAGYIWNYETSTIKFGTDNIQRMTISGTTGDVGIGTSTSIAARLHLYDSSDNILQIQRSDSNASLIRFENSTSANVYLGMDANEDLVLDQRGSNDIVMNTDSTERMRIKSDGNFDYLGGFVKTRSYSYTFGTTANEWFGICDINRTTLGDGEGYSCEIEMIVKNSVDRVSKTYKFVSLRDDSENAWQVLIPLSQSNDGIADFEILHRMGIDVDEGSGFRIRRVSGSTSVQVYIHFKFHFGSLHTITDLATTGTDATSYSYFSNTLITQKHVSTGVGYVGIGTTSPGRTLDVRSNDEEEVAAFRRIGSNNNSYISVMNNSSSQSRLRLGYNSGGIVDNILAAQVIAEGSDLLLAPRTDGDAGLRFYTSDTATAVERMVINSSGQVGIGTNVISYSDVFLQLHREAADGIQMNITNSNSTNGFTFGLNTGADVLLYNRDNTDMLFYTNNLERMRIENDGVVSFGGAATRANGTSVPVQFRNNGSLFVGASGSLTEITDVVAYFGTSDTSVNDRPDTSIAIISDEDQPENVNGRPGVIFGNRDTGTGSLPVISVFGKVGGYANSNGSGGVSAGGLIFQTSANGSAFTERMRINSSGNVGIGTNNPNSELEVFDDTGSCSLIITAKNTNGSYLLFNDTDANAGSVFYDHGDNYMAFRINGANEKMRIEDDTNATFKFSPMRQFLFDTNYASINAFNVVIDLAEFSASGSMGITDTSNNSLIEMQHNGTIGYINVNGNEVFQFNTGSSFIRPGYNLDLNGTSISMNGNSLFMGGGDISNAGDVGIGTATMDNQLHIFNSSHARMKIESSGTNQAGTIYQTSNGDWIVGQHGGGSGTFKISNSTAFDTNDRLTILQTGEIGIGTDGPKTDLHLMANAGSIGSYNAGRRGLLITGIGGRCRSYWEATDATSGQRIFMADNQNGTLRYSSLNDAANSFITENIFVLKYDGKIGIGTTNPSDLLHIYQSWNATTGIYIENPTVDTASKCQIEMNCGATDGRLVLETFSDSWTTSGARRAGSALIWAENENDDGLIIGTGHLSGVKFYGGNDVETHEATELMRISGNGNVGIGTNNPERPLHIDSGFAPGILITDRANTGNNVGIAFAHGTTDNGMRIIWNDNNNLLEFQTSDPDGDYIASLMSIKEGGNVGIGSTDPQYKLDVGGTLKGLQVYAGDSGTGRVGMTINDGKGNANIVFNHVDGKADVTGNAGRIEVNVDSTTDATMYFELGDNLTSGVETSLTEIMTLKSSGNVGIGTTNPQRELSLYTSDSSESHIQFTNSTTGAGNTDGLLVGYNAAEQAEMWNYENTDMLFATNSSERMRIEAGGDVGIGTNNPVDKLHVRDDDATGTKIMLSNYNSTNGNYREIRFTGYRDVNQVHPAAAIRAIQIASDTGLSKNSALTFWTEYGLGGNYGVEGTTFDERMRINPGGNIGIGTNNPIVKLDIRDKTQATDGQSSFIIRRTDSTHQLAIGTIGSGTAANAGWWIDSTESGVSDDRPLTLQRYGGNVGIGTSSPLNKLDVDGDIVASGNITSFGTVSDQRLKENVVNLTGSLDKINQLRTVSFIWKQEEPIPESRQGTNDTGLIAQEVEEIIPEVIDSAKLVGGNGEEYKKINYEKLTTYLIGAMQEQNTLIQELRQRIEILENN